MSPDDEQMISHSIVVNASADTLYDMVADIGRMGEWSNTCTGATWDEGSGPVPTEGAWFTGHNIVGDLEHDAHCEFVAYRSTTSGLRRTSSTRSERRKLAEGAKR